MRKLVFAAVLVVAVAVSLWRLSENRPAPGEAAPSAGEFGDGEPGAERGTGAATPGASGSASLPPSLRGTEVVGSLEADERGRFEPSPGALHLFDYYLQARGEASEAWIQAQVKREIEARLPASAQAAARALFVQYQDYLVDAAALDAEGLEPGDMERRLDALRELRRQAFGPTTALLLFEDQERIESVAIERRRILDAPNLDPRERIRLLAELQSELPEHVQRAEAEAYAPLRVAREEERLRAEGATEVEIQTLRQEQDRADSAERQATWSLRMQAYREERDRVLANVRAAPDEAKAVFLRRVRERHFEPEEVPRVEALDRIELRDRSLGNAPIPDAP